MPNSEKTKYICIIIASIIISGVCFISGFSKFMKAYAQNIVTSQEYKQNEKLMNDISYQTQNYFNRLNSLNSYENSNILDNNFFSEED